MNGRTDLIIAVREAAVLTGIVHQQKRSGDPSLVLAGVRGHEYGPAA